MLSRRAAGRQLTRHDTAQGLARSLRRRVDSNTTAWKMKIQHGLDPHSYSNSPRAPASVSPPPLPSPAQKARPERRPPARPMPAPGVRVGAGSRPGRAQKSGRSAKALLPGRLFGHPSVASGAKVDVRLKRGPPPRRGPPGARACQALTFLLIRLRIPRAVRWGRGIGRMEALWAGRGAVPQCRRKRSPAHDPRGLSDEVGLYRI